MTEPTARPLASMKDVRRVRDEEIDRLVAQAAQQRAQADANRVSSYTFGIIKPAQAKIDAIASKHSDRIYRDIVECEVDAAKRVIDGYTFGQAKGRSR